MPKFKSRHADRTETERVTGDLRQARVQFWPAVVRLDFR